MRVPGLRRLERVARWVRSRFVRKSLILLYHRVTELPLAPHLLYVTSQHFAEQLEALAQSYSPIPLQQLVCALWNGECPDRAVAVTFDDGYSDNLYNAKPLLERFHIPATVFVTTGYMRSEREFWWDELDRLLLQPRTLPATLRLQIKGRTYQWELTEATEYSEKSFIHRCWWHVTEQDGPNRRYPLYHALHQLLQSLSEGERRGILDELHTWVQAEPLTRPTHRILSPAEVLHLAEGGLIEIGTHSVSHPVLPQLSIADQRIEIEKSKAQMEEILSRPVTSFAYPYGQYTAATAAIVRQAGFSLACATLEDVVWRGTNRFHLPRVVVQDWQGEEFVHRLRQWFGD